MFRPVRALLRGKNCPVRGILHLAGVLWLDKFDR